MILHTDELIWNNNGIFVNTQKLNKESNILKEANLAVEALKELYKCNAIAYPKFYKMDILSKVAFLSAHFLQIEARMENIDVFERALICNTNTGSEDVDRKFEESRDFIASPALFVYTLPNIFMGELAIKYKIKGEHACFQIDRNEANDFLKNKVYDLFSRNKIKTALWGTVNALNNEIDVNLKFTYLK